MRILREEKSFQQTNPLTRLFLSPKILFIITFTSFFLIFFLQTVSADVLSLNSGGSNEIVLNSDQYIEGFFSGISEEAAVTTPPTNETNETGGGGGDGGGAPTLNLSVVPSELTIGLQVNTTTARTIRVTNLGTTTANITISQQDLGNHVILGKTNLTLLPGQTADVEVIFVALSQAGIYPGRIIIGNEAVLVSLNVATTLLLFDSNIVVLNPNFEVPRGDELETQVTLIPLGDKSRLDVTLNFVIKDYKNKVYLTKSETLLITQQMRLNRNFDTGNIPLGDYIIGLELVYPNGIAPSSAHFEIIEKPSAGIFGKLVSFLIIMILIVLILIIIILIWRRRKKKEEEQGRGQSSQ